MGRHIKPYGPAEDTQATAELRKQEIVITSEFDTPRELVFQVLTDPHLIPE